MISKILAYFVKDWHKIAFSDPTGSPSDEALDSSSASSSRKSIF
jgi:hypothetical protein